MGTYCITGGASGIGAGIVDRLRSDQHEVFTVDLRNADIEADLSTPKGRDAAIEAIRAKAPGGLDGFVPCAGIGPHVQPISLIPRVNFFGAVALTDALCPDLAKRKGSVVMISSNSSRMGEADPVFVEKLLDGDEAGAAAYIEDKDGQTAYGHGKFAITVWMRRNASRFIADGVRINAVAPGYITTALTDAGGEDPVFGPAIAAFVETIPVGRPGIPADIAHPVAWLLSPEASFVCGSVLYADGGHDAMLRPDSY